MAVTDAPLINTTPRPVTTRAARPPERHLLELTRPSVTGAPVRQRRFRVPRLIRRAVGPIAFLVLWQVACSTHVFTSVEVASPGQVWTAGRQLWDQGALQHNLWVSLRRVVEGLLLGVAAGVVLAVLSGFFHLAEDLIDPVLQAARAVPILGLLPLFVIWFGVGESPKVYLIALGCLFPVYINTFGAIRGVDTKLVEAGRTFGLGRFGLVWRIIFPGALPGFLVGLRFALIGSWLFVIVAEQINSESGIGYLIMQAQSTDRTDIMFLGLIIYAALGILADLVVRQLETRLLSWRRGFEGA